MAEEKDVTEGRKPGKNAAPSISLSRPVSPKPRKQWHSSFKFKRALYGAAPESTSPEKLGRFIRPSSCEACDSANSPAKRRCYEDAQILAYPVPPAEQVAREHIIVMSKEHISNINELVNSDADKLLVETMHTVGRELLADRDPRSSTQFSFLDPIFVDSKEVQHLHMHCFALPFKNSSYAERFIQSPYAALGSVSPEQLLEKLENRQPTKRESLR